MILSGAGLSAESGIQTFRDSDGLWENYDIYQVCSTQGWLENRELVTNFYNDRRKDLEDAKPNKAHYTIAELEKVLGADRVWNLTQNVDDLLERAGCKNVIHLHGTLRDLRCEDCGHIWDIGYRPQKDDEVCPECGSDMVRHNVVMFGEEVPAYRYIREAMEDSDMFVAIGTSGKVIDIVPIANHFNYSILVNPNRERYETYFGDFGYFIDEYFTIFLQKKAGEASDELFEMIIDYLEHDKKAKV
jgi:NAD-dependent deacetylase